MVRVDVCASPSYCIWRIVYLTDTSIHKLSAYCAAFCLYFRASLCVLTHCSFCVNLLEYYRCCGLYCRTWWWLAVSCAEVHLSFDGWRLKCGNEERQFSALARKSWSDSEIFISNWGTPVRPGQLSIRQRDFVPTWQADQTLHFRNPVPSVLHAAVCVETLYF